MKLEVNGTTYEVKMQGDKILINEKTIDLTKIKENEFVIDSKKFYLDFYERTGIGNEGKQQSFLIINGMTYTLSKINIDQETIQELRAPMSGYIIDIYVQLGSYVKTGESLLVLEAMKMHNEIKSPRDGKIIDILFNKQQPVKAGEIILIFD
ncbi:acyl-CoA carboxylase biotin carboxyl carrier protein subunit [Candidatus Nitrosocosmicus sp. R]